MKSVLILLTVFLVSCGKDEASKVPVAVAKPYLVGVKDITIKGAVKAGSTLSVRDAKKVALAVLKSKKK